MLVIAGLLLGMGVSLQFVPRRPGVLLSYAAMLVGIAAGEMFFTAYTLIFWGVAALIAAAIGFMMPRVALFERMLQVYVAVGSFAGAIAGFAAGTMAAVIGAAAAGAFAGAFAYSRSPRGRGDTGFSLIAATAACGLPAVVNFSITALSVARLIY